MKPRVGLLILVLVVAVALFAAPLAADAQQAEKVYRIGVLATVGVPRYADAFREGLRERGYVEGKNLVIERRYAEGRTERFPDFAAELVHLKVDMILTSGNPAAQAAKNETSTIPIVMGSVSQPVEVGLVASLARPGGNITGLTIDTGAEIAGKMLELLNEAAPKVSRVGVILQVPVQGPVSRNPWLDPAGGLVKEIDHAARQLRMTPQPALVRDPGGFGGAFALLADAGSQGLLVGPSSLAMVHRRLIVEFAAKHRMPAVYAFREFAEAGGLMSYGIDFADLARRAAGYVDKILKGAKPADLPVEQPTKFEFVINVKTAKALGLTIPPSLRLRADQVIE